MATTEAESNNTQPAVLGNQAAAPNRFGGELLESLSGLSIARQIALMVGLAASVAIGFAIVIWSQSPDFRPIYGSMQGFNSAQVVQTLQDSEINYRIEPNSGIILVEADQVAKARMALAAADVTDETNIGLEVLDKEQGLGTSQFLENARYRRGLEGELARTIASLYNVRNARVHLAIPKRSVFIRDARQPSASVFLELYGTRSLKPEQVKAIRNLVAASVPDMPVERVAVVDQHGQLLSVESTAEESRLKVANQQREYISRVEEGLVQRVHNILEPILGQNNYKAEVAADIDFTAIEQTSELFNPDTPALRSEQTLDESRQTGPGQGGVPGALSNQPPGEVTVPEQVEAGEGGQAAAAKPSDVRVQATRNFELDKTISHTRFQQGRLKRLTVAVVVNDLVTVTPDTNEVVRTPWDNNELARFTQLVKDAVGFDVSRGDSVNVINSAFVDVPTEAIEEIPFWTQPWFWEIIKLVLAGIFLLILLFGFLKPMVRHLFAKPEPVAAAAGVGGMEGLEDLESLGEGGSLAEDQVSISGAGSSILLPGPHEGYEQQLNAVRELIGDDAGRVALVIKHWVSEDD
ncbi:flagellar M-ring protein FliF [Endozoicomonas sp. SM1973]|uniref:Flagellar M-ring protein n=1 Tax=Spartinivicinus marinus TaxID=2994442 RepID=A0A853IDL7_9GAMM|nr:flagellar basal-body MS-ring/collar protein FliF [Spartinivicinus marinus]MCX4028891.1 flagellar basal-body MS-ring/collar protein FliF [Spartinivicinus marinus]NYZ65526.1 flagellar M-ring protein FliF [Spartinivicinus marinus]